MTTRTGKIACLPHSVREQLNVRLHDGETGPDLLEWLNHLDEVKAILARDFEGKPINAPNLTAWRQGGYADWVAQGQALELAQRLDEEAGEIQGEEERSGRRLSELMLGWLTAQFLIEARQPVEGEARWRRLRELCAALARLRGMEMQERKMRIAEAKLDGPTRLRWKEANDQPREARRKQRVREQFRASFEAERAAKAAAARMETPPAETEALAATAVAETEKPDAIQAASSKLSQFKPAAESRSESGSHPAPGNRFALESSWGKGEARSETPAEKQVISSELSLIKEGKTPAAGVENTPLAA